MYKNESILSTISFFTWQNEINSERNNEHGSTIWNFKALDSCTENLKHEYQNARTILCITSSTSVEKKHQYNLKTKIMVLEHYILYVT